MPRILALLFASQVLVQGTQLLCGLLIVRYLSVQDYAIYTLFSFGVGLLALIADPGMTQILVSVATKVADNHIRVELMTRYVMRRSSLYLSLALIPVIYYVITALQKYFVGISSVALFCCLLALQARLAQLERINIARRSIYRDLGNFARIGFYSNSVRLLFIAVVLLNFPNWSLAVLSLPLGTLVSLAIVSLRTKDSLARKKIEPLLNGATEIEEDKKRISKLVIPLLPGTIYGVLIGQLPLFLSLGVADAYAIGEFGALSRLGQIIGIAGVLNSNILNAYLSVHACDRTLFVKRLLLICGMYTAYTVVALLVTYFYPDVWFAIIGRQYIHLADLLVPVIVIAGLSLLHASFYFATIALERTRAQWCHFLGGAVALLAFGTINGFEIHTVHEMIWLALYLQAMTTIVQGFVVAMSLASRNLK